MPKEDRKQGPKGRPLLYVDALNFSRRFFTDLNFWDLQKPFSKIRKFVTAAINSGWHIEVFIDAGIQTKETLQKWKIRRELQVRKCKLDVPPGLAIIYGDMWKANKVKVHYSEVDNDDTLAAFAHRDKAFVLSGDKDFYRYTEATFTIFSDFEIKMGHLVMQESQYFRHPKPRMLINPVPMTHKVYPTIARLFSSGDYFKGCPSSLTRFTGNLHRLCKPIRQAFYESLMLTFGVQESFIDWNPELEETYWTFELVHRDPYFAYLLRDPLEAFDHFFTHVSRPEHSSDLEWHNHLFGLTAIVCEYISCLRGQPIHFAINEVKAALLKRGTIRNLTKTELKDSK